MYVREGESERERGRGSQVERFECVSQLIGGFAESHFSLSSCKAYIGNVHKVFPRIPSQ